jgi:hypothetical protein
MILLHYNLFYMFYTYGLHPNIMFTKYGHDIDCVGVPLVA